MPAQSVRENAERSQANGEYPQVSRVNRKMRYPAKWYSVVLPTTVRRCRERARCSRYAKTPTHNVYECAYARTVRARRAAGICARAAVQTFNKTCLSVRAHA